MINFELTKIKAIAESKPTTIVDAILIHRFDIDCDYILFGFGGNVEELTDDHIYNLKNDGRTYIERDFYQRDDGVYVATGAVLKLCKEKSFELYTITAVKAIANCEPETIQDAVYIHQNDDEFSDGDCILFGYDFDELDSDKAIAEVMYDSYVECSFTIREDGVFVS